MASLTIRKLDDAIRDELRLRAARNGRSVEDEVRVILRDAAQNHMPAVAGASLLLAAVQPGDAVMVKGSLGSRMGPLVKALERRYPYRGAAAQAPAQG